ncbi:hypothetical protein ACF0H5_014834 [Mactra antiquata]
MIRYIRNIEHISLFTINVIEILIGTWKKFIVLTNERYSYMMAENKQKIIEDDRISMITEASLVLKDLKKADITEVKAYAAPPAGVIDVLIATIILLGRPKSEQTWKFAQRELSSAGLNKKAAEIDYEKIPIERRREAMTYLSKYTYEQVKNCSMAAAAFYQWAHAVASE